MLFNILSIIYVKLISVGIIGVNFILVFFGFFFVRSLLKIYGDIMAIAAVGGASLIFAAGVVAGRLGGSSWRWSSTYTMTNMTLFGSLVAIINRVVTIRSFTITFSALMASRFLSIRTGCYLANKLVDQKPTSSRPVAFANLAAIFTLAVCGYLISERFLFRW